MMDRIEHTEHKRKDREPHNMEYGDRRYGGTWAESSDDHADADGDEPPYRRP